ncbi:MAG: hypothetical protein IPH83_08455 [Gammaproteobacteria bacterium]|nr:hypothetical protein [Gammaproteobacteria bacterium]
MLDGISDHIAEDGAALLDVWMSHGDKVVKLPPVSVLAATASAPIAGMYDAGRVTSTSCSFTPGSHPQMPGGPILGTSCNFDLWLRRPVDCRQQSSGMQSEIHPCHGGLGPCPARLVLPGGVIPILRVVAALLPPRDR